MIKECYWSFRTSNFFVKENGCPSALSTHDRCCFFIYDQKSQDFWVSNSFSSNLVVQVRAPSFDSSSMLTLNSNPMFCRPLTMTGISVIKEAANAWSEQRENHVKHMVLSYMLKENCICIVSHLGTAVAERRGLNGTCLKTKWAWKLRKYWNLWQGFETMLSMCFIKHIERNLYLHGVPSWNSSCWLSRFKWNTSLKTKQALKLRKYWDLWIGFYTSNNITSCNRGEEKNNRSNKKVWKQRKVSDPAFG